MVNPADKADNQAQPGGDHVESLDSISKLGSQLDASDGSAPGAPGQLAAATAEAERAEISAALELLRDAALPFAPDHVQDALGIVWNDKQLNKIALAVVKICHLHGWTTDDFFDKYGPYLQLCMALGLPALATLKLLKIPPPPPQPAAANGQQQ